MKITVKSQWEWVGVGVGSAMVEKHLCSLSPFKPYQWEFKGDKIPRGEMNTSFNIGMYMVWISDIQTEHKIINSG